MKLPNPKPADREALTSSISNYAKLKDWLNTKPSEAQILAAIVVENTREAGARHAIMQRLEATWINLKKAELNTAIAGLK